MAEWLMTIPSHWSVVPLRHLARVETGSRDTVDAVEGGKYPFIVRSSTPLAIDSFSYDTEAILTAGDGDVGEIFHHLSGKFDVHQRVYVLRGFRRVLGRFLYYYFSSEFRQVVAYGGAKSTVASLRRPMFLEFPVAVPPLSEQERIADYLDRETAEIDAFIADQEGLMALLAERRAATIDHAVGSPETSRVKFVVSQMEAGTSVNASDVPPEHGNPGVLKTSAVYTGEFDPTAVKAVWIEDRNRVTTPVKLGSIIVSRMNTPELVGAAAHVHLAPPSEVYLPDRLWQVSVRTHPRYFFWWTQSSSYRRLVAAAAVGASSSMKTLDRSSFLGLPFPLVSDDEQEAVSGRLDHETAEIDAAIADAREAIALSKERRAALISAAVTGQIDVTRGAAA